MVFPSPNTRERGVLSNSIYILGVDLRKPVSFIFPNLTKRPNEK